MSDFTIKTLVFLLAPVLVALFIVLGCVLVVVMWIAIPFSKVTRTETGINLRFPWEPAP